MVRFVLTELVALLKQMGTQLWLKRDVTLVP